MAAERDMEKRLLGFEDNKLAHVTRLQKSAPERHLCSPAWAGQQIMTLMHAVRAHPPTCTRAVLSHSCSGSINRMINAARLASLMRSSLGLCTQKFPSALKSLLASRCQRSTSGVLHHKTHQTTKTHNYFPSFPSIIRMRLVWPG